MRSEVTLGVRLNPHTFTSIKLTDINLDIKVEELRSETAQRVNLTKDSFDLIYCGCIMEDDQTLESYGVKSGTMIHVLKKSEEKQPASPKCLSDTSITHVATAFKLFMENPTLESAFHRMIRNQDIINNIITLYPDLHDDPVAIAMLQAGELMVHFADVETVRRLAKAHPALVQAAHHIARIGEVVCDVDVFSSVGTTSNSQPTPFSAFNLENFTHDEEIAGDSSQSSDSMLSPPPTTTSNNPPDIITTAQLAAALPAARSRIAANLPPLLPPVLLQLPDFQRQLSIMHEMGLLDDTINVQALQFMNGDVRAAIELVFSGYFY